MIEANGQSSGVKYELLKLLQPQEQLDLQTPGASEEEKETLPSCSTGEEPDFWSTKSVLSQKDRETMSCTSSSGLRIDGFLEAVDLLNFTQSLTFDYEVNWFNTMTITGNSLQKYQIFPSDFGLVSSANTLVNLKLDKLTKSNFLAKCRGLF